MQLSEFSQVLNHVTISQIKKQITSNPDGSSCLLSVTILPQGNNYPLSQQQKIFLPILELYKHGIIQYVFFSVWLPSLSIIAVRFQQGYLKQQIDNILVVISQMDRECLPALLDI